MMDYPGQEYFHANNPNIKAAEERWKVKPNVGETVLIPAKVLKYCNYETLEVECFGLKFFVTGESVRRHPVGI